MRDERCRPGAHYGCECDDAEIAALRAEMNAAIEAAHDRAIRLDHAEAEAKRLREALRETLNLAVVADEGDYFYAEQAGIDSAAVIAQASAALSEKREARGEGDK